MKAYMITMDGREDSADFTASEFEQHDIEVVRFVQPPDWPVGKQGINWNSKLVLEAALDEGEDFFFIEDDLLLNHDRFDRALADLEADPELTYLYIHESMQDMKGYYPREDSEGPMHELYKIFNFNHANWREKSCDVVMREGFRTLLHHSVYGSQCVFIPARYIGIFYEELTRRYAYSRSVYSVNDEAFDTMLTTAIPKHGIPARTWLPHPVQHTQNRGGRNTGKRSDVYSRSFYAKSKVED